MRFQIPFTFSNTELLRRRSRGIAKIIRHSRKSQLESYLKNADLNLSREEYISICARNFLFSFVFILVLSTSILFFLKTNLFYVYGIGVAFLFSFFMFASQLSYPKIYDSRKTREVEKNLIPAMQDMLVQLNSGIPIFKIVVNIASSDYGAVSDEFRKAVKQINSGKPQIEAIDELGSRTTSKYLKRVLWQISNGMRAGSDMSIVIKDGIDNLVKEQAIQIQSYGSKLNPLVMFYMLLAVILPALGITFLTIISSMLNLSGSVVKLLFVAIFVFVILLQVMFLGIIKSKRPSLL